MIEFKTDNDWEELLADTMKTHTIEQLFGKLDVEYTDKTIFPPQDEIFNALKLTSYEDTKVVIIGQDPYIRPGQAHGLAFSVRPGYRVPPSASNIFKELQNDLGCYIPNNAYLVPWAKQGVLLLNTCLTVEAYKSKSHADIGWEYLTDRIIKMLNEKDKQICFMMWGNQAKRKLELVDPEKHLVLTAAHPSPLAGGAFFGCKHFSKCNEMLYELYPNTIDWQIPNIDVPKIKF